jgi:ATP-dependent Clp protease ATP-binding subunit ClpA
LYCSSHVRAIHAQSVVAQEEAKNLNHSFIGPEHLLLGLVQGDGIAAIALGQLGVSLEEVRSKVARSVVRAKTDMSGSKVPFSPRAKKALEMSLREALRLGHNYIGTEHLVLGVLRVGDNDAASRQLLGVDANEVRARVLEIMPNGIAAESRQSPAVTDAMRLAHQWAGSAPMTTGQLLLAMLTDGASQAGKAFEILGVTTGSLESQLAQIPITGTSDAPPRPRAVEIKLGDMITTIEDSDLAAALGDLSPEQLRAALRDVLGTNPEQPGSKSGT